MCTCKFNMICIVAYNVISVKSTSNSLNLNTLRACLCSGYQMDKVYKCIQSVSI